MVDYIAMIIAFIALIYGIYSSSIQLKIARLQTEPILRIDVLYYHNHKSIILKNSGLGPAVITHILISKESQQTKNLSSLFTFSDEICWDTFVSFDEIHVLEQGKYTILAELSEDGLIKNNKNIKDSEQARKILERFQSEWKDIKIYLKYSDLEGKKKKVLEEVLKSDFT